MKIAPPAGSETTGSGQIMFDGENDVDELVEHVYKEINY